MIEQQGEGIVQLIESGNLYSEEMKGLLHSYLQPMLKANIDYLVLGCTHYSYLMPILLELLPKHIKIIDSGEAVAKQTKAVLEQHQLLNNSGQLDLLAQAPINPPEMSEVETQLAAINPDELTPREALALLYRLKELV